MSIIIKLCCEKSKTYAEIVKYLIPVDVCGRKILKRPYEIETIKVKPLLNINDKKIAKNKITNVVKITLRIVNNARSLSITLLEISWLDE